MALNFISRREQGYENGPDAIYRIGRGFLADRLEQEKRMEDKRRWEVDTANAKEKSVADAARAQAIADYYSGRLNADQQALETKLDAAQRALETKIDEERELKASLADRNKSLAEKNRIESELVAIKMESEKKNQEILDLKAKLTAAATSKTEAQTAQIASETGAQKAGVLRRADGSTVPTSFDPTTGDTSVDTAALDILTQQDLAEEALKARRAQDRAAVEGLVEKSGNPSVPNAFMRMFGKTSPKVLSADEPTQRAVLAALTDPNRAREAGINPDAWVPVAQALRNRYKTNPPAPAQGPVDTYAPFVPAQAPAAQPQAPTPAAPAVIDTPPPAAPAAKRIAVGTEVRAKSTGKWKRVIAHDETTGAPVFIDIEAPSLPGAPEVKSSF